MNGTASKLAHPLQNESGRPDSLSSANGDNSLQFAEPHLVDAHGRASPSSASGDADGSAPPSAHPQLEDFSKSDTDKMRSPLSANALETPRKKMMRNENGKASPK